MNVFGGGNSLDNDSGSGSDAGGEMRELYSRDDHHTNNTSAVSAGDVPSSPINRPAITASTVCAAPAEEAFQFHFE